jgi:exosortase A
MQPDAIHPPAASLPLLQRIPAHWRMPLVQLGSAWAALIVLFLSDWRDMAAQWWDSSTYNHILLIPLILAWLAGQRLDVVARIAPRGWWPGLVIMGGACFLWVLGEFAGLSLARQLAAVVMLQGTALALLGPRVAAAMLFPLCYMLFLVPAGDELIPFLQTITAQLTMALLALTQIPAEIDGVFITTRFGYFEVAEACSGVKFLIAMVAYGTLVSNVCFKSWPRRAGFMALSVAVPVLANGLRAWGTIFIAGKVGIEFASSFDHVFYGWFFFALVMALVMGAGWKFFDRPIDDPMADASAIVASPLLARLEQFGIRPAAALALSGALALGAMGWGQAASRLEAPLPEILVLPSVPGWHLASEPAHYAWAPLHGGADRRLKARYADNAGHIVDISFALYAAQRDGQEAGGFGQGALPLDSRWAWESPGPAFADAKSDMIQAPGPVHRLAATWLRTGDTLTGSNTRLKLANILDRLLLRARPTATLIISAEAGAGPPPEAAVRAFTAATGPIAPWMDRLAAIR